MPSGQDLNEEVPGSTLGNAEAGSGVLASLFESYAAACRTGAEVDAGSDAAYEVRCQEPTSSLLLPSSSPLESLAMCQAKPPAKQATATCLPEGAGGC